MAINSDIRDHAYQFFIEEAPELLQEIEEGLLTLRQEKNTAKVHNLMRGAHSIKGGAASVELEAIATLAHRLENIFKALYSEDLEIDTDLETQLLQAYDCLRLPLMEQITVGRFDAESALALGDPIFVQIEEKLGDALTQADNYIPSSSDLGIDMTKSIFEVDVSQGLEHLATVVAHPSDYEVAGELRAQAEVFAGFAELLNQPALEAIAATTLAALQARPSRALEIAQLALSDFQAVRQAVLAGTRLQAMEPSAALMALADTTVSDIPDYTALPVAASLADTELIPEDREDTLALLEDIFGNTNLILQMEMEELPVAEVPEDTQTADADGDLEEIFTVSPESIFDSLAIAFEVDTDTDLPESPVISREWVADATSVVEEAAKELPSLEEVIGNAVVTSEIEVVPDDSAMLVPELVIEQDSSPSQNRDTPETLKETLQSIEQIFESLPSLQDISERIAHSPNTGSSAANSSTALNAGSLVPHRLIPDEIVQVNPSAELTQASSKELTPVPPSSRQDEVSPTTNLSVRVDSERLGRMNNLVGELAINRNGLSLQNEQLQGSVRELLNRFAKVQKIATQLQQVSNQVLIGASSSGSLASNPGFLSGGRGGAFAQNDWGKSTDAEAQQSRDKNKISDSEGLAALGASGLLRSGDRDSTNNEQLITNNSHFDSLELDSYGVLHSRLQGLLEEMMQLEESVDDIVLFAKQSDQTLEQQRHMLTQLRDELMWARMLPLGEVLNRFPRMLRDLSTTYHKPVNLKLSGTSVLVDKAVLEKLYDPLLHLLRNAFDHGIESSEIRRQQGKSEPGQIEVRAYHKGSQTIIEVRDDGQGLNLERIRTLGLERGLLSAEQAATISNNRLYEIIFQPGFSTASQVSELSGRGVGLDVVRSQMRSLKGSITVNSSPGVGTTFTLRLPLTLTIAKLLVCFVGSSAVAIPSDSIEEIVVPKADQLEESATQRFLRWRNELVPAYHLADFLDYACPLPETTPSKALISVPSPQNWALPMLILRHDQQFFALEIDRLVTEQELVIKPFGSAIAAPSCTYGCTIVGDGSLIPVIDGTVLVEQFLGQSPTTTTQLNPQGAMANDNSSANKTATTFKAVKTPTILVVDDAAAMRRTLALSLERAGFPVLQARDGQEAIEQLQQSSAIELVICDIEMPNMNGFEFLSARRQEPQMLSIPVVMLTSRSNDKHRWLAMQLGANAYFTKPYLEQEFLGAIKTILSQTTAESLPAPLQSV